jgi:hypothetical protein
MTRDHQKGVLFVFNVEQSLQITTKKVRLQGLKPEANYEIEGFNEIKTGLDWMSIDLEIPLKLFGSTIREIQQKFE